MSDNSGGAYIVVEQGTPATSLWTGTSGGNWSTASDWSNGMPTLTTNAVVGVPGTYTVTLASPSAANSLAVDDANATLEIDSGGALAIAQNVTNVGTVNLIGHGASAGASMTVGGNFNNIGTLGVDDYDFFFSSGGSSLTIAGTLTNSGNIYIGNSIQHHIDTSAPVTVTAQALYNTGSVHLAGQTGARATLDITGGTAPAILTGGLYVDDNALAEFASGGITTVATAGTLVVNGPNAFVADASDPTHNSALTGLSSNAGSVTFSDGAALTITPAGGTFANSGNFALDGNNVAPDGLSGGSTAGAAVTIAGNLDNTGTLGVDNYDFFGSSGGSTPTITGTLTNSGTVVIGNHFEFGSIETSAPATLIAAALDNTGTIYLLGNPGAQATLDVIGQAAPAVLTAAVHVDKDALLEYASGGIGAVAAEGTLVVNGPQAFVAVNGATSSNSALTGLSSNAGTVAFAAGATLTATPTGGTFTNSGSFSLLGNASPDGLNGGSAGAAVTIAGNFANTGTLGVDNSDGAGGSTLTITGKLTNSRNVYIGNTGLFASINTSAPATLAAQALDNSGSIALVGRSGAQATLDITGAAPTVLDGSINLRGVALLEFGSGSFTSIATGASLTLNGPQAFVADSSNTAANGGLSGLAANAGTLTLNDASALSITGDFANSGTLNVDSGDAGGSAVSIAGMLTERGQLVIGNSGLTTATAVTAGGLDLISTLTLTGTAQAAATLDIIGAAPAILTGSITLTRNALLEFGGGSFTTIVAGASLTLDGGAALVADSSNLNQDGALSGLTTMDGTLSLLDGAAVSIAGDLANGGSLQIDASGNSVGASSLSVAGTFDNAAALTLGNGNLSAQSKLTVGALVNEGGATATVSAGSNGATAALTVQGKLTNASDFQVKPGGFVEAGSLDNEGILGLSGSAGAPTNFGVIGGATNAGALTVGAFAEMGVTGAMTDSGNIAVAGTLDVAGGLKVTGTGSILMQGGSLIDPPGGSLTIATGASLVGTGSVTEPIANNGTISAAGGLLVLGGPITGTGQLAIGGAGAALEIGGATAETLSFNGNVGAAKFDAPAGVTGAITNLVKGDTLDLAGIQATSAVVNGSTLTVTAGSQTLNYQVAGAALSGNVFAIENDQHGGTNLVLGPPGPVIAGPTTQTVFTGLPTVLGPLSIADPAAGNGTLTVTVSDTAGLLSAVAAGAGTVGGSGTNSLTLTGDLTDLNAELASLTYGSASAGTDTVRVQVSDASDLTASQTIAVTAEQVPFTYPILNVPNSELVIPGVPTAMPGANNPQQSWGFEGEPPEAVMKDSRTRDGTL